MKVRGACRLTLPSASRSKDRPTNPIRLHRKAEKRGHNPICSPLVTYVVTSENGARIVECLGKPEGRYLSMGELVDLEVDFRTCRGKDGTQHISLRVVGYKGEF
jgi:hypothetical protein